MTTTHEPTARTRALDAYTETRRRCGLFSVETFGAAQRAIGAGASTDDMDRAWRARSPAPAGRIGTP